jgi:hypothetical protein
MENQPFLFERKDSKNWVLYCNSTRKLSLFYGGKYSIDPWKVYLRAPSGYKAKINTPSELPIGKVALECNPHLYEVEGELRLGYIVGVHNGHNTPVVYWAVNAKVDLDARTVDDVNITVRAFSAAIINGKLYYVSKSLEPDKLIVDQTPMSLPFQVSVIYRVCPIWGEPDWFMLTGRDETGDRSWVVHSSGHKAFEVLNSKGQSVYKCTVLNQTLIYAEKQIPEGRILVEEKSEILQKIHE